MEADLHSTEIIMTHHLTPCPVDEEADRVVDQESTHDVSSDHTNAVFHPFSRLPPELRRCIWEFYCSELVAESCLLDIEVAPSFDQNAAESTESEDGDQWMAKDGHILDAMTLPVRRVLAVNQESRAIALQSFPDHLSLDLISGQAIVHFNKDTDVVLLTGFGMDFHASEQYRFPNFARKITQLAISSTFGANSPTNDHVNVQLRFLRQFPALKKVFFLLESLNQNSLRNLQWCIPGYVHEAFANVSSNATVTAEGNEMIFCWPALERHRETHVPLRRASRTLLDVLDENLVKELLSVGIEPLPMAVFKSKSEMARYRRLQARLQKSRDNMDTLSDWSSLSITTSDEATSDEEDMDSMDEDPTSEDLESLSDEPVSTNSL